MQLRSHRSVALYAGLPSAASGNVRTCPVTVLLRAIGSGAVRLEGRDLRGYASSLAEEAIEVGLAPELDDASIPESVGRDADHCEVLAAAVVGVGESRSDPVAGREEILHPNAAVGQPRSQHCSLGVVPALAVKARAVDEDVLSDEFFDSATCFVSKTRR